MSDDRGQFVKVKAFAAWDWDISGSCIRYDDGYLNMLGYMQGDMNGSVEEWNGMYHSEDLPRSHRMMKDYLSGKISGYECEKRIRHRDGHYIWIRDIARIAARDEQGVPVRLVGCYLDINELKLYEIQLENALEEHNLEMMDEGKALWTVNQISKKLLMIHSSGNFESLVQDCLFLLGTVLHRSRICIWKDYEEEPGATSCKLMYEWWRDKSHIDDNRDLGEIHYTDLSAFQSVFYVDKSLKSLKGDFTGSEMKILAKQERGIIAAAPIDIDNKRWGFISVDLCDEDQFFTGVEENLLLMSGSMLANAIERKKTEAELREMEEHTQLMLNATPLCCNLWTSEFYNMRCNDEAVRLFELSSQKEYLERFDELSPEKQPCGRSSSEMARECIIKAFEHGYCRFEWMHQKLDGTPVPAEITLVRIKYKDNFIVAGYTRDLREEKAMLAELKTKKALQIARDAALLSSKAKSNFLANMSHEIRTPMNAISGFADLIIRGGTDKKTVVYAREIKDACGNLINIVNDILDISKIESGKTEIVNSSYELASLLNDVIAISRMRLGSKPLMFTVNIDSRLPSRLVGDEMRIRQIMLNIISNAIKYTNEGFVELRVFGSVEDTQAALCISVKDSGIGIKTEDLERLFVEFERVNTKKNRSIEGTGLGLAISKKLCEMMGGDIVVESTYGEGSMFTVSIPQKCTSYQRLAEVKEGKRVLLYEPRERYRCSVMEILENLDCSCVACTNQSELYNSICAVPYDYILTAALYLKKVQSIVSKYELHVVVAAFADYGEIVSDDKVHTILFPVNCMQLASVLNGEHEEEGVFWSNTPEADFIAPSAHVLVADDNLVNLQVARGLMEPYQFVIDVAHNGVEAVDMVKGRKYDLVLMDHMMPEMDGIDATTAIRQLEDDYFRELPIIALTANVLVGTREMFMREGMNDFLAKPVEINKLNSILYKWLPQSKIVKISPPESLAVQEDTQIWNIAGVDTTKGIAGVGGSSETYCQILSAYYDDGQQKSISLKQHIREQDLSAFRIEVHALKSTSATIGALQLSSMAAKLELAAQKDDMVFIGYNLDIFIMNLQSILDAIYPIIQDSLKQEFSDEGKPAGTMAYLKNVLIPLHEALEYANIGRIEESMTHLQEFIWTPDVTKELLMIQKCLSVFDYDGAMECIARLNMERSGDMPDD